MRRPLHFAGVLTLITLALGLLSSCAVNEAGVNYGDALDHPNRSYLENRVMDFADIFTLNVGLGVGLHAEAHMTRVLALGLGGAKTWNFGLSERPRRNGIFDRTEAEITVLPLSLALLSEEHIWGHQKGSDFYGDIEVLQTSLDEVYQTQRDFWALGGSATLGIVRAQAEVHPLQILDFLLSFLALEGDVLADEF